MLTYLLAAGYLPSIGLIAWLIYKATSAVDDRTEAIIARSAAIVERNAAVVEIVRMTDEMARARSRMVILEANLSTERKKVISARIDAVANADPGDVGAAVDRVLQERLDEQRSHDDAIAAHGHRDRASDAVPGPGAAADGPHPIWIGRD